MTRFNTCDHTHPIELIREDGKVTGGRCSNCGAVAGIDDSRWKMCQRILWRLLSGKELN